MKMELTDGITLLSGKRFSYADPGACQLDIEDIAAPLGNICRFAGQLPIFYSVAQHAINCSRIVPKRFAYDALMHDTAEAFTNDIVTPLKVAVPLFKVLEQRIESAMSLQFGFTYPMPHEVHVADRQMLGLEMKYVRGQDPNDHVILDGVVFEHLLPAVFLESMAPAEARQAFLDRYEELRP